jgi:opacity protein-like surface antigen
MTRAAFQARSECPDPRHLRRTIMKRAIIAVAAIAALAIPAVSTAAQPRPGAYVSGFIGASVPLDTNVESSDFFEGRSQSFSDRVEFDPGIYIGGSGGYDYGVVRLEGELSYRQSEIKSITDKDDGFRFLNPDGNLGALAVMLNVFFDLHNDTPITPYWGGGAGLAVLHLSDTFATDTRDPGVNRPLLHPGDSDTVFAYQAAGGVEIAISRELSLDIGYRYFGTTRGTFADEFALKSRMKLESHNATLGVRIKF